MDDNKVSHVEQTVVDELIDKIETRFPGLTVTTLNEQTFIGIKMRFLKDKKVVHNMKDYILEVIDDFGEEVSKIVASPAARWLFTTDEKAIKLKGDRFDLFCSLVAKLLWIILRLRPDFAVKIAFLCRRVKHPDIEDWKKLTRLISFLAQTIDEEQIIGTDDLQRM